MAYFLTQDDEFVAAQACAGGGFPPERPQALGEAGMHRILYALGLEAATDGDAEDHLVILRHTLMNPWLIDERNGISYIDMYFRYLEQRIGALLPNN